MWTEAFRGKKVVCLNPVFESLGSSSGMLMRTCFTHVFADVSVDVYSKDTSPRQAKA